jgi:cell division septum initiation protein DivIVA
MIQGGRDAYDRAVEEARHEQARLVSQTEVVQAAHAESARIVDEAHAEADRQRVDCDAYVDGKLAEFSELLSTTLRTVDSGRNHLRAPAHPGSRSTLYDFQS